MLRLTASIKLSIRRLMNGRTSIESSYVRHCISTFAQCSSLMKSTDRLNGMAELNDTGMRRAWAKGSPINRNTGRERPRPWIAPGHRGGHPLFVSGDVEHRRPVDGLSALAGRAHRSSGGAHANVPTWH